MADTLLDIQGLSVGFETQHGLVKVVDGISLRIPQGRVVAVVGESGCGKTVTSLSVLRLIPSPPGRFLSGRVLFHETIAEPVDLLQVSDRELRTIRGGKIAMIFQEPMAAWNPVLTIGAQIVEAIQVHQRMKTHAARRRMEELLGMAGLSSPSTVARSFPHQLSGGMLQRAMIAMALSCGPQLLIADEPTTALDVTVQAQILSLLRELQRGTGLSVLLITHDFGVVSQLADEVYVMYAGRIVEHATVEELLAHPLHPYTQGLLRCSPSLTHPTQRLADIPGSVPDPSHFPEGCRFHPRCSLAGALSLDPNRDAIPMPSEPQTQVPRRCVEGDGVSDAMFPTLREVRPSHFVACGEADAGGGTGQVSARSEPRP